MIFREIIAGIWLLLLATTVPAAPAPAEEPVLPDGSPRVVAIGEQGFQIRYATVEPVPTKIRLREAPYPLNTPAEYLKGGRGKTRTLTIDTQPRREHEFRLDRLAPATRYYYRVATRRGLGAQAGWSPEYAVVTRAPHASTEFIHVPVKVLLVANLFSGEGLARNVPRPAPMTAEDLELYRAAFREAALFFWVNSRMKYWVDFDLRVDARFQRRSEKPEDAPQWYADLPEFRPEESWRATEPESGSAGRLYFGEVLCQAERRWRAGRREWEYSGSGGGTYGLDRWPEPGHSFFLGGSDVCWLTCHEFKHQIESQYHLSGLDREDDRMWFCHYAMKHDIADGGEPVWNWDTAADHGEHYGGLAWQLRHMTVEQWLRNKWGVVRTAVDRDNDGIPDDDPRLPLDEKRLGSDPRQADTDRDGLADMGEVLSSLWMSALNGNPLRVRTRVPYVRPALDRPDSDGDGLPDGRDPHPLYPFEPRLPRATVRADGHLEDWTACQTFTFRHPELGPQREPVDLEIRACYDDNWLYYAFCSHEHHAGIELTTDNEADGYYVGNDNLILELGGNGEVNSSRVHLGAKNRWPYEALDVLTRQKLRHGVIQGPGRQQTIELAIPRRPDLGLDLVPGEKIGVSFKVKLPKSEAWVSVFEPGDVFDSVLEGQGPETGRPEPEPPAPSVPPAAKRSRLGDSKPGSLATLVDWDSLAQIRPGWRAGMFSSTDPKGGGRDCGNFLRIEGDRHVLAEMTGPGVITRLWSANPQGQLRIEIDGRAEPAVEGLFRDLYEDRLPPFQAPIAMPSSGGYCSYWPIGFSNSCKVTVGNAPGLAEKQVALRATRQIRVPLQGAREMALVVTDGGDGFGADHADWGNARLVAADGETLYLSDLTGKSAGAALLSSCQGWGLLPGGKAGPNGAMGRDESCEGKPLAINGKKYAKGLGSHAPARHVYRLHGKFKWFEAEVGVDDAKLLDVDSPWKPSVTFEVELDGQKVYDSGLVGNPKLPEAFDPRMFFYQINYQQWPPGTDVEVFRRELDAAQRAELDRVLKVWRDPGRPPVADPAPVRQGTIKVPPGTTGVFCRLTGAGIVEVLRLKLRSPDRQALRRAVLTVHYDGDSRPAVWCPVGDFFGSGLGTGEYRTLLMGTTAAGGFYSYFPMPYAKSASLAVENGTSAALEVEYEVGNRPGDPRTVPEGRFCAAWREEAGSSGWHRAVDVRGRGQFVGLGLAAVSYGGTLGYLEGNERLTVDGNPARALTGTGMEDFFNSGWYYEQGLVSRPLHALSVKSESNHLGAAAGLTSQIRFLLPDRVPFAKGFTVELQHGVNNSFTAVRYATVAYWYQAGPMPHPPARPRAQDLVLPRKMLVRPCDNLDRIAEGNAVAGVKPLLGAVFAEDLRAQAKGAKAELAFWKDLSEDYEGTNQALFYGWPHAGLVDCGEDGKKHRGDVLLCRSGNAGAELAIPLGSAWRSGKWMGFNLVLVEGPDQGIVQCSLGSQVIWQHDAYHPFVRPGAIRSARVKIPKGGAPVPLILRVTGRNPEAGGANLGIYCLKTTVE